MNFWLREVFSFQKNLKLASFAMEAEHFENSRARICFCRIKGPYTLHTKPQRFFFEKVGEKIVAHTKTVEKIVAVVNKRCSMYGRLLHFLELIWYYYLF